MAMDSEVSLALYDLSMGAAGVLSQQFAQLLNGRTIEMIPHTGVGPLFPQARRPAAPRPLLASKQASERASERRL